MKEKIQKIISFREIINLWQRLGFKKKLLLGFLAAFLYIAIFLFCFRLFSYKKNLELSRPLEETAVNNQGEFLGEKSSGGIIAKIFKSNKKKEDNQNEVQPPSENSQITSGGYTENESSSSNSNNNQQSSLPTASSPTPTPTRVIVTPSPVLTSSTPTPTPTSGPLANSTPTPTPTVTPSVSTETKEVSLFPASSATPNASGRTTIKAIKNANGYWDFVVSGEFKSLQPNRLYQFYICGSNCSSHTLAKFSTDGDGGGNLSEVVINHAQSRDPVSRVVVWEVPPQGEIKEDPTTCYGLSLSSPACLSASVYF